jgi:hypothetical protein
MNNFPNTVKLILAIALLLCLADMPYGYYQFVRVAACVGFGILAYTAFENKKQGEGILLIVLILLFQPLEKIALGRTLWNIVDVVVAIYLLGSAFVNTSTKKS